MPVHYLYLTAGAADCAQLPLHSSPTHLSSMMLFTRTTTKTRCFVEKSFCYSETNPCCPLRVLTGSHTCVLCWSSCVSLHQDHHPTGFRHWGSLQEPETSHKLNFLGTWHWVLPACPLYFTKCFVLDSSHGRDKSRTFHWISLKVPLSRQIKWDIVRWTTMTEVNSVEIVIDFLSCLF